MEQDILVDWQNSFSQVKDRGQYLLETGKWSDCRFLVGSAPNQKIVDGHKLILAMASPVFERMFYGNLPDKTDPIVIPDVQPDAFQAMLEYIYTDKITIASFDKACELCYVAKKYLLPHVVEQCTHFLWADLSPKNACRAYEFAKLFDEPRLMQSSMEIISSKTKEVLADPSTLDIEITTLLAILDQDKLNIDSELELFNLILKYVSVWEAYASMGSKIGIVVEQPKEVIIEPTVDVESMHDGSEIIDEVKIIDVTIDLNESSQHYEPEKIHEPLVEVPVVGNINGLLDAQRRVLDLNLIKQAVKKIRFLTLSPQQFAEGPARSKLLTQNEALSILINISSPSINDCPMPEGFCISRSTRKYYSSRCDNDMPVYYNPSMALNISSTNTQGTSSFVNCQFSSENDLTNDTRRSYCVRTIQQQFDYRNTSVTDCGLTFQVDTNIWITGVQVPTQVLCGELMNSAGFSERYSEILYAHVQDMQGSRLTYTHCTSRVRYDSLLEITFDRPVYIYRNQIYKIFVVFNKVGWYPMYTCVPDIICNRVKFMFNCGAPGESVRDGLIRAIVFSTPHCAEQTRNMLE